MSYAIGALGWSPDVFWAATPDELMAGVEWHELQAERHRLAEEDNG